jgi:hypothetical protein
MARYFTDSPNWRQGRWSRETIYAVGKVQRKKGHRGENSNRTSGRTRPFYETAFVEVVHSPGVEEPNFDFSEPSRAETHVARNLNLDRSGLDDLRALSQRSISENGYSDFEVAERAASGLARRDLIDDDGIKQHRAYGIGYAKAISRLKNNLASEVEPRTELFKSTPTTTTITHANAHPNLKTTVPIMAAYAHMKYGGPITASDDLSRHSSKMVKNAQEKGLPVQTHSRNTDARVTNNMSFSDSGPVTLRNRLPYAEEIPQKTIKAAKEHYKDLAGRRLPSTNMGPQFTQLQFPGMEG